MNLTKDIENLFNELIKLDNNSAFLYLAISNYFQLNNLTGMAKWLREQYKEELTHANTLIDYVLDRNGKVEIRNISTQPTEFGSPLEAWNYILNHEQMVTETYKKAFEIIRSANDYQSMGIIQSFLAEQIDEEAQASRIIGRLKIANNNPSALLIIDEELSKRAG